MAKLKTFNQGKIKKVSLNICKSKILIFLLHITTNPNVQYTKDKFGSESISHLIEFNMRLKKINNNIKTLDALNCKVKFMQVHQTNEQLQCI